MNWAGAETRELSRYFLSFPHQLETRKISMVSIFIYNVRAASGQPSVVVDPSIQNDQTKMCGQCLPQSNKYHKYPMKVNCEENNEKKIFKVISRIYLKVKIYFKKHFCQSWEWNQSAYKILRLPKRWFQELKKINKAKIIKIASGLFE